MAYFILDKGVTIENEVDKKPIMNAVNILLRDINKVCTGNVHHNKIILEQEALLAEEEYVMEVSTAELRIKASNELGFVYGLLHISEKYLGVAPFWFWMDKEPDKLEEALIPEGSYRSSRMAVRFRGWFFNDEVLMFKWKMNENSKDGWRMCFETLLRCGGNMVIPGTDKMSVENRALAAEYGLWITHHHAEPLGAEMFIRKYPDLEPDYFKYPEKFEKLWEDAVIAQKDYKVVWNLCFRGQGDCPFWSYDKENRYDTDAKRGKVISDLMRKQADIVRKYVDNPVFCTNLYGEIMELYEQGYVTFPKEAILVRADNGFGKMVTRRRGNHNPRVNAMPDPKETRGQGIYYHVSFYDLQAANHITMFPNSVEFLNQELDNVLHNGGKDFWVINCSNVRPHVYFLDAVSKKWKGQEISDRGHAIEFAQIYHPHEERIADCYQDYSQITVAYGPNEDEHAGEQFYTENIRYFAHYILLGQTKGIKELGWYAPNMSLSEQLAQIKQDCWQKLAVQKKFMERCAAYPETTLYLQALMHYYGSLGVVSFAKAYEKMLEKDYVHAFVLLGDSVHAFEYVNSRMRESEKAPWENFYLNDCQADYKFTAYEIRKLMGYVRELGDNSEHYSWQHEYCYDKEDKGVLLLLLSENHKTDEELYQAMKLTCAEL